MPNMSPRTFYSLLWLVLAMLTAFFAAMNGAALAAALTAWLGGVVTGRLGRLWCMWSRARRVAAHPTRCPVA